MERCVDCNSLLTKEEKICVECGSKVIPDQESLVGYLAAVVTLLFYLSVLALVASPFVDRLPSFTFCVLITSALLFMMRTAKEYAQKVKKR
jgi:hypothetical protein